MTAPPNPPPQGRPQQGPPPQGPPPQGRPQQGPPPQGPPPYPGGPFPGQGRPGQTRPGQPYPGRPGQGPPPQPGPPRYPGGPPPTQGQPQPGPPGEQYSGYGWGDAAGEMYGAPAQRAPAREHRPSVTPQAAPFQGSYGPGGLATLDDRPSRRLPLVIAAVAAVVVVGGGVGVAAALGVFTTTVLDQQAVQTRVQEILSDDFGLAGVTGVSCPARQEVVVGATFTCDVSVDGRSTTVPVTIRNTDGEYEVNAPA